MDQYYNIEVIWLKYVYLCIIITGYLLIIMLLMKSSNVREDVKLGYVRKDVKLGMSNKETEGCQKWQLFE